MKKILTASSNRTVIDVVKTACQKYSNYFETDVLSDTGQIINYIDYQIPEIKVIDFSCADVDAQRVLMAIKKDPWLHFGGIIAICRDQRQVQELEAKKDTNIVAIQTVRDFTRHFGRLLRILWQNQQFLFTRGMQDTIGGQETGSFICGNDPIDIRFYTNFLVTYLYNTNRISDNDRFNLQMALMELLTNALEHGNLEISYEDKTKWMSQGGDILQLIDARAAMPRFAERRIHITYEIGKAKSKFTIADDGKGFDWKNLIKRSPSTELHGRGILLSESLVSSLSYNEKGNIVSFEITNLRNATNNVPMMFKQFDTVPYKDKQIICRQNESSNDLYFIVSGRFAVYSGRKLISVLTPNDMFIGEMAFLLNDRRSATVLAVGNCQLIRIPKTDFLSLIRRNPHYGIFLSKMLAQRLIRQTGRTLALSKQVQELKEKSIGQTSSQAALAEN